MPAMSVRVAARATSRQSPRRETTSSTLPQRRPVLTARTESARFSLPPPVLMEDLPAPAATAERGLDLAAMEPPATPRESGPTKRSVASSSRGRSAGKSGSGEGGGSGGGSGKGSASAPRPLATKVPAYPWSARKSGAEGVVLVRVVVNEAGQVSGSSVYRSSGRGDLDAAAVACVARWTFAPGQSAGRPVAAAAVVRVSFRLES